MYCRNCGKQLDEHMRFCPECGAEQQTVTTNEPVMQMSEPTGQKPAKVWTVFSKVGKILGIVCLSTSWIPFFNIYSLCLGIVGIVMSCLGRKAKTEETDRNCSIGLKLSIAAVVISSVLFIIFTVIYIDLLIAPSTF